MVVKSTSIMYLRKTTLKSSIERPSKTLYDKYPRMSIRFNPLEKSLNKASGPSNMDYTSYIYVKVTSKDGCNMLIFGSNVFLQMYLEIFKNISSMLGDPHLS